MSKSTMPKFPAQTFHCPKCGGDRFGSSGDGHSVSSMTGNCQENRPGCGFRWKRAEDWRYFDVGGTRYESAEAYDKAIAKALKAMNLPTVLRGHRA